MRQTKIASSSQVASSRLVWMDSLRGIAVFLVVLLHTVGLVRADFPGSLEVLHFLNAGVAPFRMALLMTLSGMLLGQSLRKAPGAYIKGKLAHIAWPYLVWSVILLGLHSLSAPLVGGAVTIEPWLRIFYNPTTPLWFLAYLLIYYLVSLALTGRIRTVLMVCTLGVSIFAPSDPKRLLFLFAFFLFGDYLQRNRSAWRGVVGSRLAMIGAVIVALSTFCVAAYGMEIRQEIVAVPGIVCALLVFSRLLSKLEGTGISAVAEYVGRRSMVFYVTHMPLLLVIYHSMRRFAGVDSAWLLFLVSLSAVLGLGAVIAWLNVRSRVVSSLFAFPAGRRATVG